MKTECFVYLRKQGASGNGSKPIALTKTAWHTLPPERKDISIGPLAKIDEDYLPFITEGTISLEECDLNTQYKIVILRDTGASQSLLREDTIPISESTYTGNNVFVSGVGNECLEIPLHRVNLCSDLVTGPIIVGVTPHLPKGLKGVTKV